MNKGKGFIGCTRCYKKKVDCKCIISDFHVIQSRAFYYWKFIENYPELKEKELGLEEKELSGGEE